MFTVAPSGSVKLVTRFDAPLPSSTQAGAAAKEQPKLLGCVENELGLRDWVRALTDAFGFKAARHLPRRLARLLFGGAVDVLTRSQRVNNTMFKAVTSWAPRQPSVRQGWRAVADAMKAAKSA